MCNASSFAGPRQPWNTVDQLLREGNLTLAVVKGKLHVQQRILLYSTIDEVNFSAVKTFLKDFLIIDFLENLQKYFLVIVKC